jgi:hypothetical protein
VLIVQAVEAQFKCCETFPFRGDQANAAVALEALICSLMDPALSGSMLEHSDSISCIVPNALVLVNIGRNDLIPEQEYKSYERSLGKVDREHQLQ